MPRLPDPGPLPRPFGTFQLVRRIAVGGMAEVYVALARGVSGFEKLVALKLIHPGFSEDEQFVRMLVDEAKLSVLLTHAHIAQTFDLGCVDGRYYIVMEYVDGVDASRLLERVVARRAQLPIEAALFVMNRVCQALDYASRKTDPFGESLNVIHRDVSPQNVLLSRDGDVKLTDFGIAKAALRTGETEVGVIKGKYCYMSPEQAWADPIDPRSDIFSAGVVLFELLTGRMLFPPDDNLPVLLERVRKAEVPRPSALRPEIPPEIDAIVLRALARKPEDRYDTAADFAFELERMLWQLDRTWGPSKLKRIMDVYAPVEGLEPALEEARSGRTAVTRIEGQHSAMPSQEHLAEASNSVLFSPSSDGYRLGSDPPRRSSQPATLRNLVESRSSRASDPRAEGPSAPAQEDDEEEVTTFFQRPELDVEIDVVLGGADEDATIVDRSGDLAKKLDALVSRGPARLPEIVVDPELREAPRRIVGYKPPAPLWAPLAFVGPALEPDELPPVAPAPRAPARRSPVLLVGALAALALFVLVYFATR